MSPELIREWIVKAEEDYAVLEVLSHQRKRRVFDSICFHAQQCAEKYLKALLTSHQIVPPRTHNVKALAEFLQPKEPTIELIKDLLNRLTPYAVETRYPGEFATAREAKAAYAAAKEIRRFARARLKLSR